MKIAKVIPLFRSGNYMKVNNYRPVSVLHVLSKILERLKYNRLMKFVEDFDILYDFQFGFRKRYSTFTALASAVNHIENALQFGKYSIGVYLDFSKAFDTLNHDILFLKSNHYGIRGIALDWIKSYMVNRKQYVMYNDNLSDIRSITWCSPTVNTWPLVMFNICEWIAQCLGYFVYNTVCRWHQQVLSIGMT